jgi:hypothetical protein
MTGVIYFVASLTASIEHSKQSEGVDADITGIGVSAFRPHTAWNKSDCSVFVGNPVEGPALWKLTTTNGNSATIANPNASVFSAMPGPELEVKPKYPANEAPMAEHIADISSSA